MLDRLVLGLTTLVVIPHRIPKLSAIIKPATLFKFHRALVHRKYRLLFSSSHRKRKPGPKGPSTQLIAAIVEMKRRNPEFGCVRMAQQINRAFDIKIDKDVVRRVLAIQFRPNPGGDGPSWTHDRGVGHRGDAWKAIEGSQTGIAHDGRAPRF